MERLVKRLKTQASEKRRKRRTDSRVIVVENQQITVLDGEVDRLRNQTRH